MIFRLKVWLLAAVAFLGALLAAFFKGRSAGKAEVRDETAKGREALREKYDAIDGETPDPGDAYERLRRLSEHQR